MVDDQVLLPDGSEAIATMVANALGKPGIIWHELEIRPIDTGQLRKLVQRQHAVDEKDLVFCTAHRALHETLELGGHRRVHFETDHRSAPPPLKHRLELADQILGLFFDFYVGVADDAEAAPALHGIAGEQTANEHDDRLFQRDEARGRLIAVRQADEAVDLRRHADQRVHRLAVVGAAERQGNREAQVRNERERMRRVDREGGEHGEDMVEEMIIQPGAILLAQ